MNSIELELKDERFDAILSDEDRSLRGSADLAYRFLKKGLSLINESGWVYFLLPRAVYSAPSLKKFWQSSYSDVCCAGRYSKITGSSKGLRFL